MRATNTNRLLYVLFCVVLYNNSIHAALGPQWHTTYNNAFNLLEQDPIANESNIRQLATELKNMAAKLKVADFTTRSDDPIDALDAYQLLQDPTAANIKEVERRVRVYNLARRKRLVKYIDGLLKKKPLLVTTQEQEPDTTTTKPQPTKKPSIKKQPISTKPSVTPVVEPKKPEIAQVAPTESEKVEETTQPQPSPELVPETDIAAPEIPKVQLPSAKPGKVTSLPTADRTDQIKAKLKRLEQLEEDDYASLMSMINAQARSEYAIDSIVRKLQRTIDEMLQQTDREQIVPAVEPEKEIIQPTTIEQEFSAVTRPAIRRPPIFPVEPSIQEPQEIAEEIDTIIVQPKTRIPKTITEPIVRPIEPPIEQPSLPARLVPELPLQPSIEPIITQPESPVTQPESPTALITLPSMQLLADNPQKFFEQVGTALEHQNQQLQELVVANPKDKNLTVVAPELQKIIALQSNLTAYFMLNPEVAHAVALYPEIIGHIMVGQEPTKQEQALITTKLPVSPEQLQELDKLIRDLRKQQEKIKKAVQKNPKVAQEIVTKYPTLPAAKTLTQYLQEGAEELTKPMQKIPTTIEVVEEGLELAKPPQKAVDAATLSAEKEAEYAELEEMAAEIATQQQEEKRAAQQEPKALQSPTEYFQTVKTQLTAAKGTIQEERKKLEEEKAKLAEVARTQEKLNALIDRLKKLQDSIQQSSESDDPSYAKKLASLNDKLLIRQEELTQARTEAEVQKIDNELSKIEREYSNLTLLIAQARKNPDWELTSIPKRILYQRIIQEASNYKNEQLPEPEAKVIVGKLLATMREEHIHSLLEKIIPDENDREKIKLDQAIKVGVAIQDYITDDIIKETIKQTFNTLWDPRKKRLSTERILDAALASSPAQQNLTKEALTETIETQNDELTTLFRAIDDNGIKYYLLTLLLKAATGDHDGDEQLQKQQSLIALVHNKKLKEAVKELTDSSRQRPGRAYDLDAIRGAMILDWGRYWDLYGGIRRIKTDKEIKNIIAQQAQAVQQSQVAELRKKAKTINAELLTKKDSRRHFDTVQETLRKEFMSKEEIELAKKTLDALEKEVTEEVINKALDGVEDALGDFQDGEEKMARELIENAITAAKKEGIDYSTEEFIDELTTNTAVQISSRLGKRKTPLIEPKIL